GARPWEGVGVTGGGIQPQGEVHGRTKQIGFGLKLQEAGDASRWQHEGDNEPTGEKMENGGYVNLENGIPAETQRELKKRGHDVRFDVGGCGVIRRSESRCTMASGSTSVPANRARMGRRQATDFSGQMPLLLKTMKSRAVWHMSCAQS